MKKSYFVTGACGGLGNAVAMALAERGTRVFASDIDREGLERLRERKAIHPMYVDVTDPATVARARTEIERSVSRLDGIVCAAGVYVGGPLLDVPDGEIRRALEINVMGAVTAVRELFPLLAEGSRIVLVSSESTRAAVPFTGPYVMTKCALEAYADTLRRELLPFGIRVTVIQPGAIRTHLLANAAQSLTMAPRFPVYRRGLSSAASVLAKTARSGMDPVRVAGVIVHALGSRRPVRLRRVGNDPARAFLSLLPASLIDALVRRFL